MQQRTFQERLEDIFAALGVALIAVDPGIRPYIGRFFTTVRNLGITSFVVIRGLYDRDVVARVLRPWLGASLIVSLLGLVASCLSLSKLDLWLGEEATTWLLGSWTALFVCGLVVLIYIWRVRAVDVNAQAWTALPPAQQTQASANRIFGPPGQAPLVAFAILLLAAMSGILLIVVGVTIETWHASADTTGYVSMTFVMAGAFTVCVAFVELIFMAFLLGKTIEYSVGFAAWVVRLIMKPVIQFALPTWDEHNIDEAVPPGLGLPSKAVADRIREFPKFPFAVVALYLALLIGEHHLLYAIGLGAICLVLVLVWSTIKILTKVETSWITTLVVFSFGILAVWQLLRRFTGGSALDDVRGIWTSVGTRVIHPWDFFSSLHWPVLLLAMLGTGGLLWLFFKNDDKLPAGKLRNALRLGALGVGGAIIVLSFAALLAGLQGGYAQAPSHRGRPDHVSAVEAAARRLSSRPTAQPPIPNLSRDSAGLRSAPPPSPPAVPPVSSTDPCAGRSPEYCALQREYARARQ